MLKVGFYKLSVREKIYLMRIRKRRMGLVK